jgi:SAM-dependent methyltransferase
MAVSEEDVVLAYRFFLGRRPENQEVIEYHKKSKNVEALGKTMAYSDEFWLRFGIDPEKKNLCAPLQIEEKVSPKKLELMISHIRNVWSNYGDNDAYWSVLTEEQYRKKTFDDNQEEFYKTGFNSMKFLTDSLNRNGISLEKLHNCLDFGCGTGRVTFHLSKIFKSVIGCDISKQHLKIAEEYIKKANVSNVSFQNIFSPAEIYNLKDIDVVFSIIVLQHNPPPVIAEYVKALLSILNHNGVAFLQVPTYRRNYRFSVDEYLEIIDNNDGMEMHVIPQSALFKIIMDTNCILREIREDNWTGHYEFISNNMLIQKL